MVLAFSLALLSLAALVSAKNVIILVGDGTSLTMIEAASYIDNGANTKNPYMKLENKTPAKTYNAWDQVTDSAAAATCMGTGVRTTNYYVGINTEGQNIKNIAEIYKEMGGLVGAAVKVPVTHATPAGFMAHAGDRNDHATIAQSLYDLRPDILLGGGRSGSYFGPTAEKMATETYTYVTTASELRQKRNICSKLPYIGLFADENLPYYADWDPNGTEVPGLLEMATAAIDMLDSCGKDYFLLIEGSLIDQGNHSNNATQAVLDATEFNDVIDYVANRFSARNDTLVIVTGDHESGGFTLLNVENVSGSLPNEVSDQAEKHKRRLERMKTLESGTNYATTGHSACPVIVGGLGPHSDQFENISHISDLFNIMKQVANESYNNQPSNDPVVPTPTPSTPSSSGFSWGALFGGILIGLFVAAAIAVPVTIRCIKGKGASTKHRVVNNHQEDILIGDETTVA